MTHILIKKLHPRDIKLFRDLVALFEEVFEMKNVQPPAEAHWNALLANDSFHVFVAQHNEQVVGGLTAYRLQQYYSAKPLVYLYDFAVKQEQQRKGIGKRLLEACNAYFETTGAEEVFVQADESDVQALAFYRSTGASEEKVRHFSYPLNKQN